MKHEIKRGDMVEVLEGVQANIAGYGWSLSVSVDKGARFIVLDIFPKNNKVVLRVVHPQTGDEIFRASVEIDKVKLVEKGRK